MSNLKNIQTTYYMTQPIHIVMTPTRNEAWVIRAFLESTTRWADYVIICDLFSTGGTREIVNEFASRKQKVESQKRAEVILIDNPNTPEGTIQYKKAGYYPAK